MSKVSDKVSYYKNLLRLPTTPLRVKVVIVLTVAYLLCPIDIIPDFIPVIGQLDDLIILGAATAYIARTMQKYQKDMTITNITYKSLDSLQQPE